MGGIGGQASAVGTWGCPAPCRIPPESAQSYHQLAQVLTH